MNKIELVTTAYKDYYDNIHKYICSRVNSYELASDLTQDVFMRLLSHADMLRQETIKSFLFTIASNIIVDYKRRFIKNIDFLSYNYDIVSKPSYSADETAIVSDLQNLEKNIIDKFPPLRRTVYCMYHHEGMTPIEISETLNMDRHMVYDHLFLGKKIVRNYFRKICI